MHVAGRHRRFRTAPPLLATPPADWRMPASVAVSSGLSGSLTALTAASASASAKTRPSVYISSAGGAQYIEYTVGETGDAILSWAWSGFAGTAAVSLNTVDQGYTAQTPDTNVDDRRQAMLLSVTAGDVIRLTITPGASNRTIYPLLHLKPASGPWDSHIIYGASREMPGQPCLTMENAIVAAYPTRDPIVFNYALSGTTIANLATESANATSEFGDIVKYAMMGSLIGNHITNNRPYDSSEKATLDGYLTTIHDNFTGAGWDVCYGSTSYRAYTASPTVKPTSQTGGSLEYNDEVIHPFAAANAPGAYDSALLRPKVDEYLETLYDRANLTDEIHGNSAHYTNVRNLWIDQWWRYIYTGSWGTSQIETRMAAAEAAFGNLGQDAIGKYSEARYGLLALASSSAKTALQARLDAIAPSANDTFTDANTTAITAHTSDKGHGWTLHAGTAPIYNDRVYNSAGAVTAQHDYLPADANYTVVGTFRPMTVINNNNAFLVARIQASTTYLVGGWYDTGDANTWVIGKTVSGTFTPLASAAGTISAGNAYKLEFKLNGSNLELWVNGVLTVSVTDSSITANGKAGLRWSGGTASGTTTGHHFDDFGVYD